MRRSAWFETAIASVAVAVGVTALTRPMHAQLARPRVAAANAPKLLVAPFVRDQRDSAMSLVVADGVRDRFRTAHMDRFNSITRAALNQALTESGFPIDVPLDASTLRNLLRFLNVRYVIEGSMIRRPGDSILVVARLAEATGTTPQAATISLVTPAGRLGSATGTDIANRLVAGFESFDEVADCRRRVEAGDLPGARDRAQRALRTYPNNAGAWLCIAQIREAEGAPEDSIIAALHQAYQRDTLATAVMRRLATKYQSRNDTTNLLEMLKRILTIDFRDNELRISTAQLMVRMGQPDSAVRVVNQGLEQNPASVELLGVKAIAMAAGSHWDSAFAALQTVSEIDTAKVDSLFIYRITNYARQIPDTTGWLRWAERATQKFPTQLDYWYTIAIQKMGKGDSTGAEAAARGLLSNIPAGGENAEGTRGFYARGHYVLAMMAQGHGQIDSALVHAEQAANADTNIRPQVAVIYYFAGNQMRVDTLREGYLDRAIEMFTKAKDWGAANPRLVSPASFFLGIVQFQKAVKVDKQAEEGRNCELAREAKVLIDASEVSIIAGVATNRELANQFLSNYIPAYKQRGETMIRQYCR